MMYVAALVTMAMQKTGMAQPASRYAYAAHMTTQVLPSALAHPTHPSLITMHRLQLPRAHVMGSYAAWGAVENKQTGAVLPGAYGMQQERKGGEGRRTVAWAKAVACDADHDTGEDSAGCGHDTWTSTGSSVLVRGALLVIAPALPGHTASKRVRRPAV
jgi:hypothetical protein